MIDIERFSEAARFAREALEGGAHFTPPTKKPLMETWERNVDITLTYFFGKEEGKDNNRHLSLEDVGEIFPGQNGRSLTGERIRQIVAKTAFDLWQNSPDNVKGSHPWERLKEQLGKSIFLITAEGTTRHILEDLDRGADYQFLSKKYLPQNLYSSREILKEYGIAVPPYKSGHTTLTKELEAVRPDTDSDILKTLQGKINYSFRQDYPEIFDLYFISLSKQLRNIGFYLRNDQIGIFLDKLGEAGIDVGHFEHEVHSGPQKGKHNYHFVFKLQKESIRQVLLTDPDLSGFLENPVSQIAGVRLSKLPNTSQLQKREEYKTVFSLCQKLGLRVGGNLSIRMNQLLAGCLVPIFEYVVVDKKGKLREFLYYPSSAEEEFRRFLLQNAAGLGLVKPV